MPTQFQIDWSLFLAARTGDCEAARKALAAGANPNFCEPANAKRRFEEPKYTLLRAVRHGHTAFVQLLLDSGASLPSSPTEALKLSYAARCADSPDILLLLMKRGLLPTSDDLEWATKNNYTVIREFAERSLGQFRIQYDIDELLSLGFYDFMIRFASVVPSSDSAYDTMLYPEERVIRAVWEFMCATGSGLHILSEDHETLERISTAFLSLKNCLARQVVFELRDVLGRFGYPPTRQTGDGNFAEITQAVFETMSDEVSKLSSKYFGGGGDLDLWDNLDHLKNAYEYARVHIALLRTRNAGKV